MISLLALSDAVAVALITGLPATLTALATAIVVIRQGRQGKTINQQASIMSNVVVPRLIAVDVAVNGAKEGDNTLVANVNNIAKDLTEVHGIVVGTGSASDGSGIEAPPDADPRAATPKESVHIGPT